jgi:hypothetical protein
MSHEIILDRTAMAFFIYNAFGHDIAHDGHPQALGNLRFAKAIKSSTPENQVRMNTPYTGTGGLNKQTGGGSDEEEEYFNDIGGIELKDVLLEKTFNSLSGKLFSDDERRSIIFNSNDEKSWQNKSFLIFDIDEFKKKILKIKSETNMGNYYNTISIGYIYFNGFVINPFDATIIFEGKIDSFQAYEIQFLTPINVEVKITVFMEVPDSIIVTYYDENLQNTIIKKYLIVEQTTFNSLLNTFNENVNNKLIYRDGIEEVSIPLEFLYNTFTDYIKHTSLEKIDGLDDLFISYFLNSVAVETGYINIFLNIVFEICNEINKIDLNIFYNSDDATKNKYLGYFHNIINNSRFITIFDEYFQQINDTYKIFMKFNTNPNPNENFLINLNTLAKLFLKQYSYFLKQKNVTEINFDSHFEGIINLGVLYYKSLGNNNLALFFELIRINMPTNEINFEDEDEDEEEMEEEEEYYEEVEEQNNFFPPNRFQIIGGAKITYLNNLFENINYGLFFDDNYINFLTANHIQFLTGFLPREIFIDKQGQLLYGASTNKHVQYPENLLSILIEKYPTETDMNCINELSKYKNNLFNNPSEETDIKVFIENLLELFNTNNDENYIGTVGFPSTVQMITFLKGFNHDEKVFNHENLKPVIVYNASGSKAISSESRNLKTKINFLSDFEQNVFRQIRIAICYSLLPLQRIVTEKFLKNFINSISIYLNIIKIIAQVFDSQPGLTTIQKVNSAYIISTAILSVSHCMKKITTRDNDILLDSQIKILSSIYLKKNVSSGKTGSGDIDDKLLTAFIKWLAPGKGGAGNYFENAKLKVNTDKLVLNNFWEKLGITPPVNENLLFYINNAVNSKSGLPNFFCPFASIMDGQPTCNKLKSAIEKNGVEFGNMDIIIRDGNALERGVPTPGETMRFHIKTVYNYETKSIEISAYLKIADEILINIGTTSSGIGHDPSHPIVVGLNEQRTPLEASECLREMIRVNFVVFGNNPSVNNWDDYLSKLDNNNDPASALARREIVSVSFRKLLGDLLQELNGVVNNGGYVVGPEYRNSTGKRIIPPNSLRLVLSNDRPSGIRTILLILLGKTGINPNSIGGLINNEGKFYIAVRDNARVNYSGITGGKKIRKSIKKRSNIKKRSIKNIIKKKNKSRNLNYKNKPHSKTYKKLPTINYKRYESKFKTKPENFNKTS